MRKWVERVRGSSVNMSGLGGLLGSPSEMLRRPQVHNPGAPERGHGWRCKVVGITVIPFW